MALDKLRQEDFDAALRLTSVWNDNTRFVAVGFSAAMVAETVVGKTLARLHMIAGQTSLESSQAEPLLTAMSRITRIARVVEGL